MKEGKTLLLTTHFMEESDALSDRIIIIADGALKADGSSAKLKEQYGSGLMTLIELSVFCQTSRRLGYKLVVNKQTNVSSSEIEKNLLGYLPNLTIDSDIPGGDVIFRTNQQPNTRFVQALRQLEAMKAGNRIKNYGVQNSTMDDVFLTITKNANLSNGKESHVIDTAKIGE